MSNPQQAEAVRRRNRRSAARLALLVVVMFGFGFALVPLYDVFCEITGLNGKTGRLNAAEVSAAPDTSRWVTVEFIASVNGSLPWDFRPVVAKMKVHPGKLYETHYFARNRSARQTVGQAVPSVAPNTASTYFDKTECFCFTQQSFAAGEEREMPVRFVIGRGLPEHIRTVTLSYTFFDASGRT